MVKRIVVSPKITSPDASTVWSVGDKVLVTWYAPVCSSNHTASLPICRDTSNIPEPKNFTGKLVLGFDSTDSENLDVDHPLATGFLLTDGQAQITVPDVAPKTDYIVVLFGDSGNASPEFTITGGTGSSSAPSATSFTAPAISSPPPNTSSDIATPPTSAPSLTSAVPPASIGSSSAVSSVSSPSSTALATSTTPASGSISTTSIAGQTSLPAQSNSNGVLPRHVSTGYLSLLTGAAMMLSMAL
ncbi:hypothetical protein OF83DRAFT_1049444 [Amylostereum chailletii]|nr:hypothetical protein OF83DRAFT_1049444 [Amylostereum chailletii]